MKPLTLILPLILLSLLLAIWTGLLRIDMELPGTLAIAHHGSLMVNSFLATVIFLERAVSFRSKWLLLLPFVNVLSLIAFIINLPTIAFSLNIAGAAGFLTMCGWFIYKHKEPYYYVFFIGAFCLLTGNILLLRTNFYPAAIVFWMLFLLFTIVAERLELTRFLPVNKKAKAALFLFLSLVFVAALLPFHSYGSYLLASTFIVTAAWLLKYDMAKKAMKMQGQHRYSGLLLIAGYIWLVISGVMLLIWQNIPFGYDAMLHSFFIGFVFSMIFSHAPIILPAVIKKPIRIYRPILYYWFGLLQLSLGSRIVADVYGFIEMRKISGLVNGISLLIFFVTIAATSIAEIRKINRRSFKA
jgi:hypothetical protein